MRQRMERLVILPFSAGCISEASVAVGIPQPRRSRSVSNTHSHQSIKGSKDIEDSDILSGESMKNSLRFLDNVPKPNISNGFNRLFKGFKNISQLFVEKDDDDDEDLEDLEMEMEIGCPTNVQHVTHIGWDGITTTTPTPPTTTSSSSLSSADSMIRGWNNLIPPELLALSAHHSLQKLHEEEEEQQQQLVEVVATSSPIMKDHLSMIN